MDINIGKDILVHLFLPLSTVHLLRAILTKLLGHVGSGNCTPPGEREHNSCHVVLATHRFGKPQDAFRATSRVGRIPSEIHDLLVRDAPRNAIRYEYGESPLATYVRVFS